MRAMAMIRSRRWNDFRYWCNEGYVDRSTCKDSQMRRRVSVFGSVVPPTYLPELVSPTETSSKNRITDGTGLMPRKGGSAALNRSSAGWKERLTVNDLVHDGLLARWWRGRPFQGRPKRIVTPAVARRLTGLILPEEFKQSPA